MRHMSPGWRVLRFAANREHDAALQQDADLFVRMGMLFDNAVRLQIDDREHHFLGGARLNVDAGKDRVRGPIRSAWERSGSSV